MGSLKTIAYSIVAGLVIFAVGFGVGRYSAPKTEEKTTKHDVDIGTDKSHKVTVIVEKPDGTKTTTITEDNNKTDINSKNDKSNKTIIVASPKPNWFVSAGANYSFKDSLPNYSVQVNKRLLGDIFVGVSATTDRQVGVNVGVQF